MNWYKTAKHTSEHSHSCIYCNDFLIPQSFSRNLRHHFPWGIIYKCGCGKSGLWTNSIRGPKEFFDVVYKNAEVKNVGWEKGFCNDLFCPFCFSDAGILMNNLYLSSTNKPVTYAWKDKKSFYVTNYDKYIIAYNTDENSIAKYDSEFMGEETKDIAKGIDIAGCRSLKHNLGIIRNGSNTEYGEAEYKPIYDWIKANKEKIPQKMINELRSDII